MFLGSFHSSFVRWLWYYVFSRICRINVVSTETNGMRNIYVPSGFPGSTWKATVSLLLAGRDVRFNLQRPLATSFHSIHFPCATFVKMFGVRNKKKKKPTEPLVNSLTVSLVAWMSQKTALTKLYISETDSFIYYHLWLLALGSPLVSLAKAGIIPLYDFVVLPKWEITPSPLLCSPAPSHAVSVVPSNDLSL